jgi:hypothetical protein
LVVRFCSPAEAIAFDRFHHLFVPVATRNVSRDPSLQRVGEVQNLEGVSPEEQSLRAARGSGRRGVLTLGHISGRDVARPPSSPTDILRVGGWRRPSQAREPSGLGPTRSKGTPSDVASCSCEPGLAARRSSRQIARLQKDLRSPPVGERSLLAAEE